MGQFGTVIAAAEARARTAGPGPGRERLITSLLPLLPVLVALAVLEAAVATERWGHEMLALLAIRARRRRCRTVP